MKEAKISDVDCPVMPKVRGIDLNSLSEGGRLRTNLANISLNSFQFN